MASAGDYCTAAMQELGLLGANDTMEAADGALCLSGFNTLIDKLAAVRFSMHQITRSTWTIVSGTETYAVGAGAAVNIVRPVFVQHVNFIDTSTGPPTLEFSLPPLLTDDAYAAIAQKDLESPYPLQAYYNPTYPTATLTFWPVPTSSTLTGVIYAATALTEISALATTIAYPPGYREMLIKNLALYIAPAFQATPSPLTVQQARYSMDVVERANVRIMDLGYPQSALVQGESGAGLYNIQSDVP